MRVEVEEEEVLQNLACQEEVGAQLHLWVFQILLLQEAGEYGE